jgi:hypothetical protein
VADVKTAHYGQPILEPAHDFMPFAHIVMGADSEPADDKDDS